MNCRFNEFLSKTWKSSKVFIVHCKVRFAYLCACPEKINSNRFRSLRYTISSSEKFVDLKLNGLIKLPFRWHSLGYWTDNWGKPADFFKIQEGWIPNAPERPLRESAFWVKRRPVAKYSAANCLGNATLAWEKGL